MIRNNRYFSLTICLILFTTVYYVLPIFFSSISIFAEFESKYNLIYQHLICGLSSILIIYISRIGFNEYGIRLVVFDWRKVFLIVLSIKSIPFSIFLIQLLTDNLILSNWMLMSLLKIGIVYLVIPPIIEELFFRGVIQTLLMPFSSFGMKIGSISISVPVIISTAFFVLIHQNYTGIALIFVAAFGILSGYLKDKYQSIIPCVFAHITFNLFSVFIPRMILIVLES